MDASFWNDRYAGAGYVYGQAPNAFVTEMARHIPTGPVLCLAEGEGRNAAHLATLGHSVTAVDLSEVGLTKARRLAAVRGVVIQTLVANSATIASSPERGRASSRRLPTCHPLCAAASMRRRRRDSRPAASSFLRPTRSPSWRLAPADRKLLMTLAALREELAGLEFLVAREVERDISEGESHTGRSAVVQVVARRHA